MVIEWRDSFALFMNTLPSFLAIFALSFLTLSLGHADPTLGIEGVQMPPDDGKLRIICFGAHPDDCELRVAGTAARWAELGHHVLFVSVTNGDIGHWREAGGPLAQRRKAEVDKVHEMLGIQGVILDNHDGELEPTLENRRTITRLIRKWKADIVIAHRPNDYHPDHRYTGVLIQDAAFMVTVPFFCPDVPKLDKNPSFFYYQDRFQKPNPFRPDVVVAVDGVFEKKLNALTVMRSQFHEGGALGSADLMPSDPAKQKDREDAVHKAFMNRYRHESKVLRPFVSDWYSEEEAKNIQFLEGFELCEYGSQPSKVELRRLFPFFGD